MGGWGGGVGGYGSGRWGWHSKKETVEYCRSIDASRWQREGILTSNVLQSGASIWSDPETGKERASISYQVNTVHPADPWLRLRYDVTDRATGTRKSYDYRIQLVTTRPHFGGLRWWFVCPLVVNGRACDRRVRKLYLAPGCSYFGCRHCLNLTYKSAQEHDKRVDFLRKNPDALFAIVDDGVRKAGISKLGLALRALRWP